jgi:CubicO group peptidase (beta-lactamase class C family)
MHSPTQHLIRFVLAFGMCLFAVTLPQAQDATLTAKVDAVFANYDKPASPGCALGVIKDGKLVYARGYGMANLEHNIPNSPKLIYDLGSTSKQFTAASILLLQQQGKLALDDDVRKFIPELPVYQKPVTIRHLVHHTSGLRDYLVLFSLAGVSFDDTTTEDDALKLIVKQKELNFAPGDEWLYSNSGYFLLSIIVKRASGKSLAEFAQENIFKPLGMKNTIFLDHHKRIVPGRATGYGVGRLGDFAFRTEMSNFEQTGDGAVYTSVEDLLLWDQNFYEPKIGGAEFLKRMHEVGKLNNGEQLDYAAGLFIEEYKGLRKVSHGGAWAGYRSDLVRFPDQKLSVACLCNLGTANPSQFALQVAEIYLADQIKAVAAQPPTNKDAAAKPVIALAEDQLKDKTGLYLSRSSGELRRITLRDGKLRIDPFTPGSFELAPTDTNTFFNLAQPNVEVVFDLTNPSQKRLTLKRAGGQIEVFEAVKATVPTKEQLAEYTGSYYSEELDTIYKLRLENDKLFVVTKTGPQRPLLPTFRDGFTLLAGTRFKFSRDAQGRVASFVVQAGRTRNLRFTKQP